MRPLARLAVPLLASALLLAGPATAASEEGHGEGAQAAEHGDHGINWASGFAGEKDGVEPSLLWRPKGMPAPLLASVFNSALLFFLLYWFGRKPLAEGLRRRKNRIVAGMDEAARMKDEAAAQLAQYEQKLHRIEEEIERVRADMREAAEAERHRVLAEAKERRERLVRDAEQLVTQELKAVRQQLLEETVRAAVRSAEALIQRELGAADHDRLAREYLEMLRQGPRSAPGAGA
jgi:F-type H+-transporting ATPase subunit b